MTKAQRKAQRKATRASARARKAKAGGHRKSRRTAGRRKAGKRTVALRNLKKARSVRARRKRAGGPRHKVKGYSYSRRAKRVRVNSHMSYEDKPRKHRRSRRRKHAAEAAESKPRRSRKRRSGGRRRKLSMKKSAVAARRRRRSHAREASESPRRSRRRRSSGRRRSSRRHKVKGHYARSRSGRRHRVKTHYSRETSRRRRRRSSGRRRSHSRRHHHSRRHSRRRGYSMENPLEPMEILVGALTGTLGFIAADALDRVWATHALLPNPGLPTGTDGKPNWTDNPAMTGGSYPGLYNATAVLAPMDWKRWLSGVGITAAPFLLAMAIKNPVGRSSLQLFGFGAGVRILGKAADDLMAKLFGRTSWGARLYDGEARAAALRAVNGNTADPSLTNYPTSGLGALPEETGVGGACGCVNCTTGVGSCCRKSASAVLPPPSGVPQAPGQPANPVVPPASMTPSAPAAPPPTNPTAPPAQFVPRLPSAPSQVVTGAPSSPFAAGAAGLPRQAAPVRKNPYAWGGSNDQAAE